MRPGKEKTPFSLRKRLHSTTHAARGIGLLLRHGQNAWLFIFFALAPAYLGYALHISLFEWVVLILVFMIIMTLEMVNTAIEIDIDLTSPEYHPFARDTKDIAAGAVLLAVFFGGVIGMIIFLPKVFALFS